MYEVPSRFPRTLASRAKPGVFPPPRNAEKRREKQRSRAGRASRPSQVSVSKRTECRFQAYSELIPAPPERARVAGESKDDGPHPHTKVGVLCPSTRCRSLTMSGESPQDEAGRTL